MDKLIIMGRKIMPYFAIGLFICWTWAMILNGIATPGEAEAHAWTITRGMTAPQAAGKIHTDFEKGFIRAEIISPEDYINYGGEVAVK